MLSSSACWAAGDSPDQSFEHDSDRASTLLQQLKGDKAEPILLKLLAAQEAKYGHDAKESAIYLGALGSACEQQGKLDDAKRYFQRAITIATADGDPQLPYYLRCLGHTYMHEGDNGKAQDLFNRGISILTAKDAVDRNPTTVLRDLLRLNASCYMQEEDYQKAEPLLLRLHTIHQRLGNDSDLGTEEIVSTLKSLGRCRFHQNDPEKAVAYFEEAYCVQRDDHDVSDLDRADTLREAASTYASNEDYVSAVAMYGESLRLRRKAQPAKSPELIPNLAQLGEATLRAFGAASPESALPVFEELLEIENAHTGPTDYADALDALVRTADAFLKYHYRHKAMELYERVLVLRAQDKWKSPEAEKSVREKYEDLKAKLTNDPSPDPRPTGRITPSF